MVPMDQIAPLDYRYALDAAMSVLARTDTPFIRCNVPALSPEIHQRIPEHVEHGASAGLWVEPMRGTWKADLHALEEALADGAPLVVIASRPLARTLPERRRWDGQALGLNPGGIGRLHDALGASGFVQEGIYGVHSVLAIGLNLLGRQVGRWGRPELGDRLHFWARLRYCVTGPFAGLSTVALLIARKERAGC